MNVNLLVKINFLVLGLLLCGYAMFSLKNDGMPQSVGSIFGISSKDNSYLTWCDTRAQKLVINDSITLFQKEKDWFALVGRQEKRINTIAMEKWFSQYCRLSVHFTKQGPKGSIYSNKLGIQFISGVQATFKKGHGINLYKWKQKYFESPHLEKAMKDLNKILK